MEHFIELVTAPTTCDDEHRRVMMNIRHIVCVEEIQAGICEIMTSGGESARAFITYKRLMQKLRFKGSVLGVDGSTG